MNPDYPVSEAAPSISAAELRRRLLASTPPLAISQSSALSDADIDLPSVTLKVVGRPNIPGRLTMPGTHGPVSANALAPTPSEPPPAPIPRSRLAATLEATVPPASKSGAFPVPGARSAPVELAPGVGPAPRPHTEDDYRRIKQENRELRKLLDEMKQLLQEASDNEQTHSNRETQIAEQLAQKQRQVDELTDQIQMIEEQVASGALMQAPRTPKTRTELEDWSDELEQEGARIEKRQRVLENDRKQLREDEESLERQMRQMEVSMAKERALMARQETELKRLSAEIQHELEIMQRGDASLREHLSKFQRRAADVIQGRIGPPPQPPTGGRR